MNVTLDSKKVNIKYHLPLTGAISVYLHEQSADVYKFLEKKKELFRLNKLDHLGLLREVFQGAHHSRWEYIVLTLFLIDKAKQLKDLHLGSNVNIGSISLSKTELMKSWTMLLNVGHLFWTFTAERALLQTLKKKASLRAQLLSVIKDNSAKKYVSSTIRMENIYRFYQCLSFYRLYRWYSEKQDSQIITFVELLKSFCVPENNQEVLRLIEVYSKIRSLAYLILDSYYISSFVELDLRDLMINEEKFREVLCTDESPLRNLISNMEMYLYDAIYLSAEAAQFVNVSFLKSITEINRIAAQGFDYVVDQMTSKSLIATPPLSLEGEKKEHFIRLPFKAEYPFTDILLSECRPLSEERNWNRLFKGVGNVMLWPFPDRHQKNVDIFVKTKRKVESVTQLYYSLINRLIEDYTKIKKSHKHFEYNFIQGIVFKNACSNVMKSLFRELFEFRGSIEFKTIGEEFDIPCVLVPRKQDGKKCINEVIRSLGKKRIYGSRRDELQALRHAVLLEKANRSLILIANTFFFESDGKQLAELDGAYICLHYNAIKVILIEAKDTHTPSETEIQKQLSDLVNNKLRLKSPHEWSFSYRKCGVGYPDYGKATITLSR